MVATRHGAPSVHLTGFPDGLGPWRDDALAEKWRKVRVVRGVVTGALEIERAQKRIGSSLEAHPIVHVSTLSVIFQPTGSMFSAGVLTRSRARNTAFATCSASA